MKDKIKKRSLHCLVCGEPFTSGSEYISLLISTDEMWERSDYCLPCWEANKQSGQFWRGKIPEKRVKKLSPDEKALELFRKTDDKQLLSVLALYLVRRNQIVRRSDTYYEIPETGEVIVVPKVTLSAEEGKKVGEELVKLLDESSP